MVKLHFANMTTIDKGIQLPGSTAIVEDDYGKELVRLAGVSYVEAPKDEDPTDEDPKKKAKKSED